MSIEKRGRRGPVAGMRIPARADDGPAATFGRPVHERRDRNRARTPGLSSRRREAPPGLTATSGKPKSTFSPAPHGRSAAEKAGAVPSRGPDRTHRHTQPSHGALALRRWHHTSAQSAPAWRGTKTCTCRGPAVSVFALQAARQGRSRSTGRRSRRRRRCRHRCRPCARCRGNHSFSRLPALMPAHTGLAGGQVQRDAGLDAFADRQLVGRLEQPHRRAVDPGRQHLLRIGRLQLRAVLQVGAVQRHRMPVRTLDAGQHGRVLGAFARLAGPVLLVVAQRRVEAQHGRVHRQRQPTTAEVAVDFVARLSRAGLRPISAAPACACDLPRARLATCAGRASPAAAPRARSTSRSAALKSTPLTACSSLKPPPGPHWRQW